MSSTTTSTAAVSTTTPTTTTKAAPAAVESELDHNSTVIVSDAVTFWENVAHAHMSGVKAVSADDGAPPCSDSVTAKLRAWECVGGKIVYSPSVINAQIPDDPGALAIVLAHEVAHVGIERQFSQYNTDDIAEEHRADCAAGAFMSWVVNGHAPNVDTTLENVQKSLVNAYPPSGIGELTPEDTASVRRDFIYGYQHDLSACMVESVGRG